MFSPIKSYLYIIYTTTAFYPAPYILREAYFQYRTVPKSSYKCMQFTEINDFITEGSKRVKAILNQENVLSNQKISDRENNIEKIVAVYVGDSVLFK